VTEVHQSLIKWQNEVSEVQMDFADGIFVPHVLPGPEALAGVETTLKIECHLMVQQPESWVSQLLEIPAVEMILVQVESEGSLRDMAQQVKAAGRQFGLALKPETGIEDLRPWLPLVDQVLILAVEPGFNGSPFIPEMMDKVKELRREWNGPLEVDGGMNPETAELAWRAGASQIAVGSYLQLGKLEDFA
jgi:ribulose-phosphate 3-epimerase